MVPPVANNPNPDITAVDILNNPVILTHAILIDESAFVHLFFIFL